MNELREQFEKETGIKHKEVHLIEQKVQCFDDSYVEWLEDKLNNNEVLERVINSSKPTKFEWWTKKNLGLHWDFDEWQNSHVWSESDKEYLHMDDC
jgi:hypothetical protein